MSWVWAQVGMWARGGGAEMNRNPTAGSRAETALRKTKKKGLISRSVVQAVLKIPDCDVSTLQMITEKNVLKIVLKGQSC